MYLQLNALLDITLGHREICNVFDLDTAHDLRQHKQWCVEGALGLKRCAGKLGAHVIAGKTLPQLVLDVKMGSTLLQCGLNYDGVPRIDRHLREGCSKRARALVYKGLTLSMWASRASLVHE